MNKVLIMSLMGLLLSCSTTKECTCVTTECIIVNDTLVIPEIHDHILTESGYHCIHIEESYWPIQDTIWIDSFGQ